MSLTNLAKFINSYSYLKNQIKIISYSYYHHQFNKYFLTPIFGRIPNSPNKDIKQTLSLSLISISPPPPPPPRLSLSQTTTTAATSFKILSLSGDQEKKESAYPYCWSSEQKREGTGLRRHWHFCELRILSPWFI